MPTRITPLTVAVIAVTCALIGPPTATAQVHRVADPSWTTPRTADGQPDLQGLWGNKTITPTERPDSAEGRAYLTDEDMAAANRQRIGRIPDVPVTRSHPPASWPSAANSSICRTYRKTAGEESRRRSPVANRWMRP